MKLRKTVAALAIIGVTGLFATGITEVTTLVDKINETNDVKVKTELIKKLDSTLLAMNEEDRAIAKKIIDSNLKQTSPVKE